MAAPIERKGKGKLTTFQRPALSGNIWFGRAVADAFNDTMVTALGLLLLLLAAPSISASAAPL